MNVIPDVPKDVKLQIHRENEMEKKMLFEDEDNVAGKNDGNPNHSQDYDNSNNNVRQRGNNKSSTHL